MHKADGGSGSDVTKGLHQEPTVLVIERSTRSGPGEKRLFL